MASGRMESSHSKRFALDGTDVRKLGTGFLIALVGAVATVLSDAATSIDFGLWSPFVSMAISVVVNALRKWMVDNSTPPPVSGAAAELSRGRRFAGWTTETTVLVLTAITLGLIGLSFALGRSAGPGPEQDASVHIVVADEDRDAITRVFVLQRQLFARVCLEAAKRERSGVIQSEEGENAWCEPRWAAARSEAFGLLAERRDRQLENGWAPEQAAAGLEAWALAADPNLAAEVSRR